MFTFLSKCRSEPSALLPLALSRYFEYYHNDRTHLGLGKDTPLDRPAQPKPSKGKLVEIPKVGGLHHRYKWDEAA
jgi:hypothetical protein